MDKTIEEQMSDTKAVIKNQQVTKIAAELEISPATVRNYLNGKIAQPVIANAIIKTFKKLHERKHVPVS